MIKKMDKKYQKDIKKETTHWNSAVKKELKKHPPDYSFYKESLPYRIYRHKYVMKMLSRIHHNDKVLELGCYNGWFSLEMARKGAHIDAYDISYVAINSARKYYTECKKKERFTGTINYFISDLNHPVFKKQNYGKIVIRNVLHHLVNLDYLYKKLFTLLKPNGLILIDDAIPVRKFEAIITGILLFMLPTDIPYRQKVRRVFKKGNIINRTKGLIDSKDSSPFEGISGDQSLEKIKLFFQHNKVSTYSAFIGAITPRLKITPPFIKIYLLKMLNSIDSTLTRINILRGTVYYFVGLKDT